MARILHHRIQIKTATAYTNIYRQRIYLYTKYTMRNKRFHVCYAIHTRNSTIRLLTLSSYTTTSFSMLAFPQTAKMLTKFHKRNHNKRLWLGAKWMHAKNKFFSFRKTKSFQYTIHGKPLLQYFLLYIKTVKRTEATQQAIGVAVHVSMAVSTPSLTSHFDCCFSVTHNI